MWAHLEHRRAIATGDVNFSAPSRHAGSALSFQMADWNLLESWFNSGTKGGRLDGLVDELHVDSQSDFSHWLAQVDEVQSDVRRPTIIYDGIGARFAAVKKWSPSYLSRHVLSSVNVLMSDHTLFSYVDGQMADEAQPAIDRCLRARSNIDITCSQPLQQATPCRPKLRCARPPEPKRTQMSMREFWARASSTSGSLKDGTREREEHLYGTHRLDYDFEQELIRRDLRGLRTWMVPSGAANPRFHLWFGTNVTKQDHFDQVHNLYTVLYGLKRVWLSPPSQLQRFHQFPRVHGCKRHSMVEFDADPQVAQEGLTYRFTELRDGAVASVVVDLLPGETLYIPPWWIHRVESHGEGVAVSAWWSAIEQTVVDELRAVSMAVAGFEPVLSASAAATPEERFGGVPVSVVAVVAALFDHINHITTSGALRALITQRYEPFYGFAPLENKYHYTNICAKGEVVLETLATTATVNKFAQWREQARDILSRVADESVRSQLAQDEAELLVGASLGVAEIQPFLVGCYGHLVVD
jgi:hypothetical protein